MPLKKTRWSQIRTNLGMLPSLSMWIWQIPVVSDISVVLKKYVEGSHWPCKENFHVEEMGLSSLREREIILKIALKWKWAKSQKLFKSWIEGRQPCIYLNKFHSYTVVVNPELDYLFFQKHSFVAAAHSCIVNLAVLHCGYRSATGSAGLGTPPSAGRRLSGSVERRGLFSLPGKHQSLSWVRVACKLQDGICYAVTLPPGF